MIQSDTPGEEESERALRRLELIDTEVSLYGHDLVKCDDYLMAKKYGHRVTPALVFFRHGKVIHFEGTRHPDLHHTTHNNENFHYLGDIMDEEEVLYWLTDPDNMESSDHIEKVNSKMFERLLQRKDFLAAFFCK